MKISKFTDQFDKIEKRNIKFALSYLVIIILSFILILFKFTDFKMINIEFVKSLGDITSQYVEENFLFSSMIYAIFIFIWVMLCGFMSPVILLGGYLFGPIYSTILITVSHAIGASVFFSIFKIYFKSIFKKIFEKKHKKIIDILNKDSRYYFLFFRILGGFGTPSPIQNIIPILIKISLKEYFIITLLGTAPLIFIWSNFGSSIKVLADYKNINLSILNEPKIIISLIGLAILAILPIIVKRLISKKN